jgi:hypothetical protein
LASIRACTAAWRLLRISTVPHRDPWTPSRRAEAALIALVLHEINTAITKLRERYGLTPFDDGFPGDRPNVFQIIRAVLLSADAAPPGAHAG